MVFTENISRRKVKKVKSLIFTAVYLNEDKGKDYPDKNAGLLFIS